MIKRLLFLLAAMFLLMPNLSAQAVWDGSVATSFAGGTGTQDDPYLIEDGAQLAYLAKITNDNSSVTEGKYYKLIDDIVLNENVLNENFELNGTPANLWTPIANVEYRQTGFMGDFDGNGHSIMGMYVVCNVSGYHQRGLFGALSGSAVVHDLAIVDSYMNTMYCTGLITGVLNDNSVVRRCYASGKIEASNQPYIGLVAGYTYGSSRIEYCYSYGSLNSIGSYIGGILGGANGGSIGDCFAVAKQNGGNGVVGYGGNNTLYYDKTVASNISDNNSIGKTTEEMKTEEFAQLLGEPFEYVPDNYPRIKGLPAIGETTSYTSGFRLNVGTLINGGGCKVKFYNTYDNGKFGKTVYRAETGETVYLQPTIKKNMLLTNNSLIISNNESGQTLALTNVAENIWSFTMPESSVTVTASFHKDPKAPIVWDGSVATSFAGGTGTQDDPYLISSGEELAYLAKITNDDPSVTEGKYYKLTENIILNEEVLNENFELNGKPANIWTPIAYTDNRSGKGFRGDFNGDGHCIMGLYIEPVVWKEMGLFGSLNGNAVVHDLAVMDSYMEVFFTSGFIAGSVYESSHVTRCYSSGTIVGSDRHESGHIVGWVYESVGRVDYCYANGVSKGTYVIGGIVGGNYGSSEAICNNYSAVQLISGGNGGVGQGSGENLYYDTTLSPNASSGYATGKSTEEMQSEEFAQLLGEPFVYAEGNYPYIEGLPKIGEDITFDTSGYRLNLGQLKNRRRSQITFYNEYSADAKSTHRAEAGQTVYLRVTPTNRWLLTDGSLVVVNDANNQSLALTSVAENVFSFTMPEYSVTVSAAFNRDPSVEPVWDGVIASAFDQGKGTEDDPYLIHDGEELAYLAKFCNENCEQTKGKYYKMVEDIYLNEDVLNSEFELRGTPETRWTPIGTESNYFQGVFDGNYHTIHGLYTGSYDDTSLQYGGLFGVTGNATIKNVGLVDSYVDGYYTGAIVAWMGNNGASRVQNCYTSAAVRGSQVSAAIAGYVYGNCVVENCYASGRNFSSYRSTGLICMLYSGAIVRNCFSAVKAEYLITAFSGSTTNLYQDVTNVYGDGNLIPILSASISAGPNLCFKSTSEMQTEKFAKLLGDEFECDGDDYPYIPGLPKVADRDGSGSTGYFLTSGTLTNGRGSRIRYYSTYTDGNAIKGLRRAEAGQKVYVHLNLRRHMLLTEGSLQLTNDLTGQSISLSKEDDLTWSFTMPTADVTVTAALHRDPAMPPVWDGTIAEAFAEGEGTEDDPYLIHDGEELAYLAQLTNANGALTKGKYYKLANDIYLNDQILNEKYEIEETPENIWTPIGISNANSFQGTFDGSNHIISGVYIPEGTYVGLFGNINNRAIIKNLNLIDTYVEGINVAALVWAVANNDSAYISNCFVEAVLKTESSHYAGMLAGFLYSKGSIENCYSTGAVIKSSYGGGIASNVYNGSHIKNCYSTVKNATAISSSSSNYITNVYYDRELSGLTTPARARDDYRSAETVEMMYTDFAARMGEPYEYVLGNYPCIPGLLKIGENRGWTTPTDPTHGGAGNVWDGETSVIFASGTGTEDDPYIINNGAQLSYLSKLTKANASLTKGRYYKLGADIKLNESVLTDSLTLNEENVSKFNKWEPIGTDNDANCFLGVFDGANHSISGVYIPEGTYVGLFGNINNRAIIKNLNLIDTYVEGINVAALVWAVANNDSAYISNCFVEAVLKTESSHYAGMLAGFLYSKGSIENCYSTGAVIKSSNGGGIASNIYNGSHIKNCFSTVKNAKPFSSGSSSYITNVYSDEDLGSKFSTRDDYCSKHTVEMHTTDFATRMGEPFEYVLGNYPYIPGLQKIGENRGWTTPTDPTHGGAGGVWDGETSVTFASGTGTEEDPYIINNGAQLNYLAKLTNANGKLTKGKFYKLGADIKLNEQVLTEDLELNGTPTNKWEPIGIDNTNSFQGKFDGQNYTISGVYIPEGYDYSGLFGFINSSEIHDLSLVDTYTKGSYASGLVGVVAQSDSCKVSHCFVEAVTGDASYAGIVVLYLYGKGSVDHCYATGKIKSGNYKGAIVTYPYTGCKVKDCYSTAQGAAAIGNISGNNSTYINNVYYDRERSGATSASTTREDLRSAETTEMLSTDFAARMGAPYEYATGYYPYIYGMHKISSNGKTSIVNGYSLQLGSLNNGSGCTIEFYRGYKKKTMELSLPVVPGSKVFVDNQTTIYAKVNTGTLKRLSDEGLTVTGNTTGNKIDVSDVDYDLYSFPITNDAVKVAATFLDGSFCGDPEVNNGRDVKWKLNSAKTGLFIEGSGTMVTGLWNTFANTVQTIDVGEGVTNVDAQAFKSMNKAKTVTLPATLQTIGSEAFSGCSATVDLRPCTLLTALHANEFAQFSGIVWLPATVTAIEADAFSGTYANVQHVYSPVADGKALYANGAQVPEKDGWGDIASFGIKTNVAIELQWFAGFDLNTVTSTDGVIACYSDRALSKVIPNGSKALRGDDQTPIYIKVTPKAAKILFVDGLTVKGKSGKVSVTQEEDEVFSFIMPAEAVTVSAQYTTGGYCGNTAVNNGHNLIWTLDGSELAFQKNVMAQGSNTDMSNYASGGTPWQSYSRSVKDINIGAATSIGDYAFRNCTGVVGMVFGETPMPVGTNAFATQMILIVPAASYSEYQSQWAEYSSNIFRDKETLTMADGQQWRTYYSKVGRMLPSGLKAYTVTGISSSEAEVSQALDYIPAGQAVLIENSAKTACTAEAVTSLETCLMTTDENNLLQWLTAPKDVTVGEGYTLYKDEFVMVSSGTLPAGIAFLPTESSNAARRLTISRGMGEITDIDNVSTDIEEAEATWYSLDGKKLSGKPTGKGIYLRNGKKVVIK